MTSTEYRRAELNNRAVEQYVETLAALRDAELAVRRFGTLMAIIGQPGFQQYAEVDQTAA